MRFSITCANACSISWSFGPGDRKTRGLTHTGCGCFSARGPGTDPDLSGFEKLNPPGTYSFVGRVAGRATQKAIRRQRAIRGLLIARVRDRFGVEQVISRRIRFRR
jgi:hypothetical protein